MNTREIAKEVRLSHWASIIRERQESGLSVKAYCERAGFHSNSYFYWQKKLRETACDVLIRTQDRTMSMAQPVFAELKIPTQPASLSKCGNLANQICIETAGVRLTADGEYPVDKLAELLRVVSQECC